MSRRRPSDRGSAAIWVLACGAVVLAVAAVVVVRTLAVLARHRAESAADLAALAAAGRIGVGGRPCAAARAVAAADDAVVRVCTVALDPSGRSGTVRVQVSVRVDLPVIGAGQAQGARARAGAWARWPRRARSTPVRRAPTLVTCHLGPVWHAVAGRKRSGLGRHPDPSDRRGSQRVGMAREWSYR